MARKINPNIRINNARITSNPPRITLGKGGDIIVTVDGIGKIGLVKLTTMILKVLKKNFFVIEVV